MKTLFDRLRSPTLAVAAATLTAAFVSAGAGGHRSAHVAAANWAAMWLCTQLVLQIRAGWSLRRKAGFLTEALWLPMFRERLFRLFGWAVSAGSGLGLVHLVLRLLGGTWPHATLAPLFAPLAALLGTAGALAAGAAWHRLPLAMAQRRITGHLAQRTEQQLLTLGVLLPCACLWAHYMADQFFGAQLPIPSIVYELGPQGGMWLIGLLNGLPNMGVACLALQTASAVFIALRMWQSQAGQGQERPSLWLVLDRPLIDAEHLRRLRRIVLEWDPQAPVILVQPTVTDGANDHLWLASRLGRLSAVFPRQDIELADWRRTVPPPGCAHALRLRALHTKPDLVPRALNALANEHDAVLLFAHVDTDLTRWRGQLSTQRTRVLWLDEKVTPFWPGDQAGYRVVDNEDRAPSQWFEARRPQVFLSYRRDYRPYAEALADLLEPHAHVLWDGLLFPGDDWNELLPAMLQKADAVIVIAGSLTQGSTLQMAEIERTVALNKRLLPVVVDAFTQPAVVLSRMYANVDASGRVLYLSQETEASLGDTLALTAKNILGALNGTPAPKIAEVSGISAASEDTQVAAPPSPSASPDPAEGILRLTVSRASPYQLIFVAEHAGDTGEHRLDYQPEIIDHLLAEYVSGTGREVGDLVKTLSRMLLPASLAPTLGGPGWHTDIRLTLDAQAARLPWEILLGALTGADHGEPVAVTRAWRDQPPVRSAARRVTSSAADPVARALLIGAPDTRGTGARLGMHGPGFVPTPEAIEEVRQVSSMLQWAGVEVEMSVAESSTQVMAALYRHPYRLLLISGNGVSEARLVDGRGSVTGMPLSDGAFLTAMELNQMEAAPEVALINACHLGGIADSNAQGDAAGFAQPWVQSLLNAGARCVLAPAWAVDDQAARVFSQRFFEALLKGDRFSKAVLHARRSTRQAFPESSTWAAYQAWGDADYLWAK